MLDLIIKNGKIIDGSGSDAIYDDIGIKNGKIVEKGTHTQLLTKKGYYHELYTRQYEEEATAKILA